MIRSIWTFIKKTCGEKHAGAPKGSRKPVVTYEDEYCNIEVLPAALTEHCRKEMNAIDEFSEAHRDGVGYNDVYERKEAPLALAALGISRDEMLVCAHKFASERTVAYAEYGEAFQGTYGFGESENVVLFFECNDAMTVSAIWLRLNILSLQDMNDASRLCAALAALRPLIVAHWSCSKFAALENTGEVTALLKALYEVHNAGTAEPS